MTETAAPARPDWRALLRDVADRVEADPGTYDQGKWIYLPGVEWSWTRVPVADPPCGTTACIGGHLVMAALPAARLFYLGDKVEANVSGRAVERAVSEVAGELLDGSGINTAVLFHGEWRPRPGVSVPDALRRLADGATLGEVTSRFALRGIGGRSADWRAWARAALAPPAQVAKR